MPKNDRISPAPPGDCVAKIISSCCSQPRTAALLLVHIFSSPPIWVDESVEKLAEVQAGVRDGYYDEFFNAREAAEGALRNKPAVYGGVTEGPLCDDIYLG